MYISFGRESLVILVSQATRGIQERVSWAPQEILGILECQESLVELGSREIMERQENQ